MFCITIVFGSANVPLLFRSKDTFEAASSLLKAPAAMNFNAENLAITDDYGHSVDIKRSAVHGIVYEEMEKSALAQIERGLHHTRVQIAAEKAGQSDPGISSYMKNRNAGPAVISPFNGAFRN